MGYRLAALTLDDLEPS